MRKVTVTEKYRAVNEGQLSKANFLRDMRMAYPSLITPLNGYDTSVQILKNKGYISEKGLSPQSIINTHCHIDHVLGVDQLKDFYNIPFYIGKPIFILERYKLEF